MTNPSATNPDQTRTSGSFLGHPIAFLFFFWGEFAERASFYGMKAILPLYFATSLEMSDATSNTYFYWFKMACYALPLLGGFLADRFFGKYWTIVGFSIPYVVGHFILGIENITAAAIALVLLAGGSGVIKPNISTLMGMTYDQQRPGETQLRSSAFTWFYFAINIGALISTLAMPELRENFGYAVAFQFPAWLMVVSLGVFALGKNHYARETRSYQPLTAEQRAERRATVRRLFAVFGLMVLFWIPYEHNDSQWIFFARDYVNLQIPFTSKVLNPDQLQFLNPLCVIICAPLFAWMFPKLDPQAKLFTAKTKILLGFFCGVASCGFMTAAGFLATPDNKVSIVWLAMAYIFMTIGEVLVYGTGLELAFAEAPESMKGFITGCFLLTTTIANFFNSYWVHLYGGSLKDAVELRGPLSPGLFFGASGLFVVAAAIIMLLMNLTTSKPNEPSTAPN